MIRPARFIYLPPTVYVWTFPYLSRSSRPSSSYSPLIGAALIVCGGMLSGCDLALLGLHRKETSKGQIRRKFTSYIVFGLEFFIAETCWLRC
jgi:hypothetical protein